MALISAAGNYSVQLTGEEKGEREREREVTLTITTNNWCSFFQSRSQFLEQHQQNNYNLLNKITNKTQTHSILSKSERLLGDLLSSEIVCLHLHLCTLPPQHGRIGVATNPRLFLLDLVFLWLQTVPLPCSLFLLLDVR